jgi:hypothetical protein
VKPATEHREHISYRVRSPHRLVLVLAALVVNFLLYSVLYSTLNIEPNRAAELAAGITFLATVIGSYAFKAFLEEA